MVVTTVSSTKSMDQKSDKNKGAVLSVQDKLTDELAPVLNIPCHMERPPKRRNIVK